MHFDFDLYYVSSSDLRAKACRGDVEYDAHPGGVEGEVEEATEKWPEELAGDEREDDRVDVELRKKMLELLQALASLKKSRVERR